jgi:hypothetical protein
MLGLPWHLRSKCAIDPPHSATKFIDLPGPLKSRTPAHAAGDLTNRLNNSINYVACTNAAAPSIPSNTSIGSNALGAHYPKMAAREDAKKMKNMRPSDRPNVGRIMVGQNAEKATRY